MRTLLLLHLVAGSGGNANENMAGAYRLGLTELVRVLVVERPDFLGRHLDFFVDDLLDRVLDDHVVVDPFAVFLGCDPGVRQCLLESLLAPQLLLHRLDLRLRLLVDIGRGVLAALLQQQFASNNFLKHIMLNLGSVAWRNLATASRHLRRQRPNGRIQFFALDLRAIDAGDDFAGHGSGRRAKGRVGSGSNRCLRFFLGQGPAGNGDGDNDDKHGRRYPNLHEFLLCAVARSVDNLRSTLTRSPNCVKNRRVRANEGVVRASRFGRWSRAIQKRSRFNDENERRAEVEPGRVA